MRILLVEDEPRVAHFIAKGLREQSYAVDIAMDGEAALYKASTNDYELIILDVMLPLKNGFEVCKQMRSQGIKPPVKIADAQPEYPAIARQARQFGVVILEAVIDARGGVETVRATARTEMAAHRRRSPTPSTAASARRRSRSLAWRSTRSPSPSKAGAGANIATEAFRAGLIDQCHLFLTPVVVGGGKPALPDRIRLDLELLDLRRFTNGTVHLQYRVHANPALRP